MLTRRHWIPPLALIAAQLAQGCSWALLFWIGWTLQTGTPGAQLAWLHTVVLGWITMAAFAVLLHAIPAFTGGRWRGEGIARAALVLFAVGVALLVAGFLGNGQLLPAGGTVLLAAVGIYATTALVTLGAAARGAQERVERAVARAFMAPIAAVLLTALAGFGMAWMLGGVAVPSWIAALPPAHAVLGLIGWLTLLIFGVSARTLRPITGGGSRFRWMHIVVGLAVLIGVPLLAAGLGLQNAVTTDIGAAFTVLGCAAYMVDAGDILIRSSVPHRPAQLLAACAIAWLAAGVVCGIGTLAGRPWGEAAVVMIAAGWAGQMVNAHLYHIGVRLISTIVRGDEDETRPIALLQPRLTWYSAIVFQIAVGLLAAASLNNADGLAARSGLFGMTAWIAMAVNMALAARRAARIR